MQSGVQSNLSADMAEGHLGDCSPKHLRTGVNAALVNDAALVNALIKKGLITHEEFMASVAEMMEAEKKRYEAMLSERFKANITLA